MRTTRTLIAVAVSLTLLALAGCGGGGGNAVVPDQGAAIDPAMVGVWSTNAGIDQPTVDRCCLNAGTNRLVLELRADGTLTMKEYSAGSFVANSLGTWRAQGGVVTASWSCTDTVFTCELAGDDLVLTAGGIEMRFWPQSS